MIRFKLKELTKSSILRLILLILILIVPINLCTMIITEFVFNQVHNQVLSSSENSLNMNTSQIDYSLQQFETRMYYELTNNTDLLLISSKTPTTDKELLNERQSIIRLSLTLNDMVKVSPFITAAYVYFPEKDYFITSSRTSFNSTNYKKFAARIYNEKAANVLYPVKKWISCVIDGHNILFCVTKFNGICSGAWVDLDQLYKEQNYAVVDNPVCFYGISNDVLVGIDPNMISGDLLKNSTVQYNGGSYIVISSESQLSDLSIIELLSETSFHKWTKYISLLRIVSLLSILTIPALLLALYKWLTQPFNRLIYAMEEIQKGNLKYRITPDPRNKEFFLIENAFNQMVSDINSLKIQIYEEQLQRNKVKMRLLSQQIKPHFILNALNIIYSYEPNEYDLIQKMVLNLSLYFRYLIRNRTDFVLLDQEVQFITNYLEIQKARYPEHLKLNIAIDNELKEVLIPPLIIQTFVENAIKYSLDLNQTLTISVSAQKLPDNHLLLSIQSDGKKIDKKIIDDFNFFKITGQSKDTLGIGFQNTVERLNLLYNGEAQIEIPYKTTGTEINIILPLSTRLPEER